MSRRAMQALPEPRVAATPRRTQRGASLLVVVVMLLAIGLMSLTAFHLARGQFQLVGNLQHQELAFQQAEAAGSTAEQWLGTSSNARLAAFTTYDSASPGLYPAGKLATLGLDVKTMNWSDSNSVADSHGRYFIEQIARASKQPGASMQMGQRASGACRSVDLFRVVARSSSTRGSSRMVETILAADGCY